MEIGAVRMVWYVSLAGGAVLTGRLIAAGLFRQYPAFTSYLSAALVRSLVLAFCF
jgi:hypothetical protein